MIVSEIKKGEEELVGQSIRDGESGWRGLEAWIDGVGLRHGLAAWGLGQLESSTEWVSLWVGDVELRVGLVMLSFELGR